ncbi:choice-of-anchor L domain-containing protein [Joostella sp. CR20]|uniref:choice-of-anchor L domain-containing protein n=1 Tax=Joostella sp. CR20 TaxID=2804312 RepID=UPI00313AD3AB
MCTTISTAQQITIEETPSVNDLINEQFINGCIQVSNVNSPVNGSISNINSYGYFTNTNTSFPFSEGIVISSGNIHEIGGGINTKLLSAGDTNWGGDADLEAITGVTQTYNATTIEFEFIASTNTISFNYILASEEYSNYFPCEYSDSFAFLIQPADGSEPYQNIAVIPGTNTPIATNTIRQEIVGQCEALNEQYFEGYNIGDTNYNGRTVPLTATATIEPNRPYRIKLIVADQRDTLLDSAIFIEGSSFNTVVDLGPDISSCANSIELQAVVDSPIATYQWFLNDVLLPETTATITATAPGGTYKVISTIPLGLNSCITEDEILVELGTEQATTPLTDFIRCDEDNDASEVFDLTEKNPEVINSVGNTGNYQISYHLSAENATQNNNPQTQFTLTNNSQEIFVRIEDLDNGCLAYNHFNLIRSPLPEIKNNAVTVSKCDTNIMGFEVFYLDEITPMLIDENENIVVTYHETQTEAESGINALNPTYINYQSTKTLYVRIRNTISKCFTTTEVTLNIDRGLLLTETVQSVNSCDPDLDGFATFNLVEIAKPILDGLSNVTVSYHLTTNDALANQNPILNPTNFTNTRPFQQIIYVRIKELNSDCVSLAYLRLFTNRLLTETNLNPYYLCDDTSSDGVENFDLLDIEQTIAGVINNLEVDFYLTATDRDSNTNPIDKNVPFTNTQNPQTLYLSLQSDACAENEEIEIGVSPNITITPLADQQICDDDQDERTQINLTQFSTHYNQGNPIQLVSYYTSQSDAEAGENNIRTPSIFENTQNPQTIYVRVFDVVSKCEAFDSFQLNIQAVPITQSPTDINICTTDNSDTAIVNLQSKINEIISDPTNYSIQFHNTLADAENNTNSIQTPDSFETEATTVFIRIQHSATGCLRIVPLTINISNQPITIPISDYTYCDTDLDGIGEFIFRSKDNEIRNSQNELQIIYYTSLENAENRTNAHNKDVPFFNTTNPQTIYARVENINNQNCFEIAPFNLVVNEGPKFNPPTDLYVCDDATNDGQEIFNLAEVENEIRNGYPDLVSVSFHEEEENASYNSNPLSFNYTNNVNPQTIFTRIEASNGCTQIVEFELNVILTGLINTPIPINACETDQDETTTFDLTDQNIDILGIRQNNVILNYFTSVNDADANTNQISTPETYTNTTNPELVYVRATNTNTNCYAIVPLELNVSSPPKLKNFSRIALCKDINNVVNLAELSTQIAEVPSEVEILYFSTNTDAENERNALPNNFIPTANLQTLYAKVFDKVSRCFAITSFDIQLLEKPTFNTPPDLKACSNNAQANFDLSLQSSVIQGPAPRSQQISYFTSEENASMNLNPITTSELSNYQINTETEIYVRLENPLTGCFVTTSFKLIIENPPEIPIDDVILKCEDIANITVDASTGTAGETYLWSTGATTASITIQNTGHYWVEIQYPLGCSSTKNFSVETSEVASIVNIETISLTNDNSITVHTSGSGNYVFSLNDGPPQTSNIFNNVPTGYHTVTVEDLNGCATIAQERILILGFPKFFTPNGDGIHETWHLTGATTLAIATVRIFDRYGKLIKVLHASDPGWDGTYNGKHMPETDYWFTADLAHNEDLLVAKGHFSLVRK